MPCHPSRARELLAKGRAVVHRNSPFVIRLRDRTVADSVVTGVALRIDPGSQGTGLALTDDLLAADTDSRESTTLRRGLYAVELQHRGEQIRKAMRQRADRRRGRRSRNLRHRAPRFSNRTRPAGWLAPSLQHRVDSTLAWVDRLRRWVPVTDIHVKLVAFDTHALSLGRESLNEAEYQQGTPAGYEVRQYLLEKWGRACAYCGAENTPLQVDHIHPRSAGGSDRISNLTLACEPCNQSKAARPIREFLRHKPQLLERIQQQLQVPLRAKVPTGKNTGTHTGRVAVRATGKFNIRTAHGIVQAVHQRHVRLLQRADGYGYTTRQEARASAPAQLPE